MDKVNNLDVLAKMSKDNNKELKFAPINTNLKRAQSGKDGWGEVTIAMPNDIICDLLVNPEYYVGGFLIAKREEFNKYKKQMEEEGL
jgi:hypothetical protein